MSWPEYLPSSIPTVDEMRELSERGWGTSWEVVGSSLATMVEGCGADQDWIRLSDEVWRYRQQRAAATVRTVARREAARHAERDAARRQRAASERAERLREARYDEEARQVRLTLQEYRRTHPYGVEAYGPAGPHGEAMWYPIEMRVISEEAALALAEHLHRVQGLTARAVHW